MKKLILLAVASSFCFVAFSQESRYWKLGIGTGWAKPEGHLAMAGPLIYLEPTYSLSSTISVGVRGEVYFVQRGVTGPPPWQPTFSKSRNGNSSFALFGQYNFSVGPLHAFIGEGAGMFFLSSVTKVESYANDQLLYSISESTSGGTKFGFFPRIGFTLKRFTLTSEYNYILGNSSHRYTFVGSSNGNILSQDVSVTTLNNYLSVKIGFVL